MHKLRCTVVEDIYLLEVSWGLSRQEKKNRRASGRIAKEKIERIKKKEK